MSDFRFNEAQCYDACKKKNYLKDFTWLKRNYDKYEDVLTSYKHCIYKYEFPKHNAVYIGLTINLELRHKNGHCSSGSVFDFCKQNNIKIPKPKVIQDKLSLHEASKMEKYYIEHYKDKGFELINKAKGGSLGSLGRFKYTYTEEELYKRLSCYKNRTSLEREDRNLYRFLSRHKLLDKYFPKKYNNQYG